MKNDPLEPIKPDLDTGPLDEQMQRVSQAARTRRMAWILSVAGAAPFVVLTLVITFLSSIHPLRSLAIDALATYGAVILSFLGGIRWGVAMKSSDPETGQLSFPFSVIPSLLGWFSLVLPLPYLFGVQLLAFAAQGAWDAFAGQNGVFGQWYVKLRSVITFVVVLTLALAFLATI